MLLIATRTPLWRRHFPTKLHAKGKIKLFLSHLARRKFVNPFLVLHKAATLYKSALECVEIKKRQVPETCGKESFRNRSAKIQTTSNSSWQVAEGRGSDGFAFRIRNARLPRAVVFQVVVVVLRFVTRQLFLFV